MADAALFEFLHTEMVAELWAHHSDPGPGVSAGPRGGGEETRAAAERADRGPGERRGRVNGPGGAPPPPLPRWALARSYVK